MTVWDLLARLGRRWYLLLAVALLTAVAVWWAVSVPPTYFANVRVVFVPPASTEENVLVHPPGSLIDFAGVVGRSIESSGAAEPVSAEVTLLGEGRTEGFLVRQANSGGQWQYAFDDPVLEVQAVGSTPEEAMASLEEGVDAVRTTTTELQDDLGVPSGARIVTTLNPSTPRLERESGSKIRAVAAIALVGGIAMLVVAGVRPRGGGGASPRSPRGTAGPALDERGEVRRT
ncbi:hypothetical protein ACFVAJ_10850 [Agromyces sp. NPDC057679]|uniref:hypothetical protein n=1 Tax=Agromyces sp. NPDC057679 TaxID=3346207 RepID=UPI00366D1457